MEYTVEDFECLLKYAYPRVNTALVVFSSHKRKVIDRERERLLSVAHSYSPQEAIKQLLKTRWLESGSYIRKLVFETSFSDLPLHINDEDERASAIISWRIEIGK